MNDIIEIKIPADPKFLKLIRRSVMNICELAEFSSKDSNQIVLAIDEACTNIIRHAYGGATTKPIILLITILADRIRFVLQDYGKKTSIESFQSRDLEDIRPGGLGVHLIRTVMDTFDFRNVDQRNELILEKFFSNKREA
jgi:anti-sigma regulatory factor (Ser/Thr protein kinase)